MKALLREPLLHFLVLGVTIFIAFSLLDDTPAPVAQNVLTVTERDAARLAAQFEATWRRPPTASERAALIDRFIEEEVLVREARALGLDRDDAIVRQRLAQKMTFLLESSAEALQASDEALAGHLAAFPDRFRRDALVAFEQVALRDAPAEATLAALRAGAEPDAFGGPSLLPPSLPPSPRKTVDGIFGTGVFDAVAALPPGIWAGPVAGAYGPHLVRLEQLVPERLPPLDEIRDAVERDWRATRRTEMRNETLKALESRYLILRNEGEATR